MSENPVQGSPSIPGVAREDVPDWQQYCRIPTPSDLAYIKQTWLSAYRTSPWAGVVPNNLYDHVYSETINQLTLRGMKFVVVANPAAPELMLGWLAYEVASSHQGDEYVVHFIFVKPTYRQLGIASKALASVNILGPYFYTFRTPFSKYLKQGRYRPEIARRKAFKDRPSGSQQPQS